MNLSNKKVLVAGGSGFIGINIAKRLIDLGIDTKITYHTEEGLNRIDFMGFYPNSIFADFTNQTYANESTKNIDILIMANAVSFGAKFIKNNPLQLMNPNIRMNLNLLEAAMNNGVERVLYLGSTTAYPERYRPAIETDMYDGDDPPDVYFSVGHMKRFTETLLRLYSEKLKKFDSTVLRLSNVYGPYDKFDPEKSHVLAAMVKKFADRQDPLEVWGDGGDSRDLIYINDTVDAVMLVLESNDKGFNAYNIGSGISNTIIDIINTLQGITGFKPKMKFVENHSQMIRSRDVNIEKAKFKLGFSPKFSLEDGIKATYNWYNYNFKK